MVNESDADERFAGIRPYRDHEVRPVLDALVRGLESGHIHTQSSMPIEVQTIFGPILPDLLIAAREVDTIDGPNGFVDRISKPIIEQLVRCTTDGVSVSGIENVPDDRHCIYISNHSNIVMDATWVNYGLYTNSFPSIEIVAGKNLMTNPVVESLLKLNKNISIDRDDFRSASILSAYADSRVFAEGEEGNSLWIAQKSGRAKDGNDRSDYAVLKMLHSKQAGQGVSFNDYVAKGRIIPVTLTYEFNACDILMAAETHERNMNEGRYEKKAGEDIESMRRGILGPHGRVHIHFGAPLSGDFSEQKYGSKREMYEDAALALDRSIHSGYKEFPTLEAAYHATKSSRKDSYNPKVLSGESPSLYERVISAPMHLRTSLVHMYARPLLNMNAQMQHF